MVILYFALGTLALIISRVKGQGKSQISRQPSPTTNHAEHYIKSLCFEIHILLLRTSKWFSALLSFELLVHELYIEPYFVYRNGFYLSGLRLLSPPPPPKKKKNGGGRIVRVLNFLLDVQTFQLPLKHPGTAHFMRLSQAAWVYNYIFASFDVSVIINNRVFKEIFRDPSITNILLLMGPFIFHHRLNLHILWEVKEV